MFKADLEGVFKEFFERGILNSLMVETSVCLICKKENANKIKEFWRITLITNVYKILAKVLANQLRKVFSLTIFEAEGAFLLGKRILDQALIANEAMEEYRSKKKEGVLLKLDFEKAYDHVDWDFLNRVMMKKVLAINGECGRGGVLET